MRAEKKRQTKKLRRKTAPRTVAKKRGVPKKAHRVTVWRKKTGRLVEKSSSLSVLDAAVEASARRLSNEMRSGKKGAAVTAKDVAEALSRALCAEVPYKAIQRSFRRVFQGERPQRPRKYNENEEDVRPVTPRY